VRQPRAASPSIGPGYILLACADTVEDLGDFSAIWCVPASPYANTAGAVAAIRFARETRRPFLGTCGGFQHALLEYAEAAWGLSTASHAELDPEAPDPVIAKLDCALVEATGEVHFAPGSHLAAVYGACRRWRRTTAATD
jgi:CTP synthase (UTP-ammonia lyase)